MNTPSRALVRDPLRDQALLAYPFRSRADLYGFTDYMIMCSEVLRAVDIDDGPGLVEPSTVDDFFEIFLGKLSFTRNNVLEFSDLVFHPFDDLALDLIEIFAREYAGSRVPVIHWMWREFILPKLYNLLRVSWPESRVTRQQLTEMAPQLRDALYLRAWPDSFFESAEECMICRGVCITTKHPLVCGHWGCDECVARWLKEQNSCPFCRGVIYWDLDRDSE